MSLPEAELNGGDSAAAVRERIAAAMVQLVGARGYEATSVEMVCERARVEPALFELLFADKERCFLSLHAQIAAEFCSLFRTAWSAPSSWHDRIWAAGWTAMRFLGEDVARTRFLLVEVNGVGPAARAHRDGILRRLAELIDEGRRETGKSGRALSPCSAEMVAGAIYRLVLDRIEAGAIEKGEDFLSELVYIAVMPYLGVAAAEGELGVQPLR